MKARWLLIFLCCVVSPSLYGQAPEDGFAAVQSLFNKHCLDCHEAKDPEANLVLENYQTLLAGGESGKVIIPGKGAESLLLQLIEGTVEKDGKKKIMPPGKRPKLTPQEIQTVRGWIDRGALPPASGTISKEITVRRIEPRVPVKASILSATYHNSNRVAALGKYERIDLVSTDSRTVLRTLTNLHGNANALVFSRDGEFLFSGSGENSLYGESRQWRVRDGMLVRSFVGHADALYALAVSPDGKILATGSYDHEIKLWNIQTGAELRTLHGHNGAVFALAFRPDGTLLASGSADRTVKLWDVATGERRDTLSQPLKDIFTVAFSPDGKRLFAGGVDSRIRVWEISPKATETTNPLLISKFGHEGSILKLVFSADGKHLFSAADDRLVKMWRADDLKEELVLEKQPDWPSTVAPLDSGTILVGRLDGSIGYYETTEGKSSTLPKPVLTRLEPRGVLRGTTSTIQFLGNNLASVTGAMAGSPHLKMALLTGSTRSNEVLVSITTEKKLDRGSYDVWLTSASGETAKVKVHVDDLPQWSANQKTNGTLRISSLPASVWGSFEKAGEVGEIVFPAEEGSDLVVDVAAKSLGSKAALQLTLMRLDGTIVARENAMDGSEPVLAHHFDQSGEYRLRCSEVLLGASPDHFYRVSLGKLSHVTGIFPLSIPAGHEGTVQLFGYNLEGKDRVQVQAHEAGEVPLTLDPEKYRAKRTFKIVVGETNEMVEAEPNDSAAQAFSIEPPVGVSARFQAKDGNPDVDFFQFKAQAGSSWMIETMAAQLGSPADTKVEVLWPDGKPVERLLLQAVRDSAVTFRGIDSNNNDARVDNWQEMDLNQYLYFQGDVARIFRMPQGPDSGFLFYNSSGKRRAYFDTTATAHALDEPCYVVEARPSGTKLVANGLPVFHVNYVNDDDGLRKTGTDSRLHFVAPKDGNYLIRVTESESHSGLLYSYRLRVREAHPDFKVALKERTLTIPEGSGQAFTLSADRLDDFEGEILVSLTNLPPGCVVSTPLVIQAGQTEAKGTLHLQEGRKFSADALTNIALTASAMINDQTVTRSVMGFEAVKISRSPKLFVALEPDSAPHETAAPGAASRPLEITIHPGETIPARLKVRRNGHEDLITFTVENLPHGVIVDNIGLSGVLIPKGQDERQIFLSAAKWVEEMDRPCFAVENQAGKQTSLPVLLHVRKPAASPLRKIASTE